MWLKRIFHLGLAMSMNGWRRRCRLAKPWWICLLVLGRFSVLIGKRQSEAKVYAVDLNPDAVELLKLNVRVNRVENRVFPICADAREIASDQA